MFLIVLGNTFFVKRVTLHILLVTVFVEEAGLQAKNRFRVDTRITIILVYKGLHIIVVRNNNKNGYTASIYSDKITQIDRLIEKRVFKRPNMQTADLDVHIRL